MELFHFIVNNITNESFNEFRIFVKLQKKNGRLSKSFATQICYTNNYTNRIYCRGTKSDIDVFRECYRDITVIRKEENNPMLVYVVCNSKGDYSAFKNEETANDIAAEKNSLSFCINPEDWYHVKTMTVNDFDCETPEENKRHKNYWVTIDVDTTKKKITVSNSAITYKNCRELEEVDVLANRYSGDKQFRGIVPSLDKLWLGYAMEAIFKKYDKFGPFVLYSWQSDEEEDA